MRPKQPPYGLYYNRSFLSLKSRAEILDWLSTIYPLWEERYSAHNPPPEGQSQRQLLRPVYWLGNWQFACLDYYHPPKGVQNRCVRAEPFPPILKELIARAETIARGIFRKADIPTDWHLNTCLVNLYGDRVIGTRPFRGDGTRPFRGDGTRPFRGDGTRPFRGDGARPFRGDDGKRVDCARVGEHKDFEPGPVASISLGSRALFQFVSSTRVGSRDAVIAQQWLDDGSLQLFGGDRWKKHFFHRVQRVDKLRGEPFKPHVPGFETRRVNFTFRYVPEKHIVPFAALPRGLAQDVRGYMEELARHSDFFRRELC